MSDHTTEKEAVTDSYKSKLYNEIIPLILISLGSFYVSILLYRYIRWRYRKQKAKKMRINRQKLERFFMDRAAYLDSRHRIQKPSHCYSDDKPPFDSNVTLVVNGEERYIKQQYLRHSKKETMSHSQQRKRRQLLWQWSVSMGYCRYSHGHHLDSMIDKLVKRSGTDSAC
ncbi:uncharacterized protein EV154DRAFT_496583 [Mucor mucedo]|uniref:uncharacterized protein n=1 Tax=Mucor mucedo TaxID=29922 RepID=UPI00221E44E6|nr:uncharacterized protein EV154DRAFT_496583 [Mucor mucedo]KAI7894965.1 hypothetical protein EV154DRAFT_496583 [Mucor mucedo]